MRHSIAPDCLSTVDYRCYSAGRGEGRRGEGRGRVLSTATWPASAASLSCLDLRRRAARDATFADNKRSTARRLNDWDSAAISLAINRPSLVFVFWDKLTAHCYCSRPTWSIDSWKAISCMARRLLISAFTERSIHSDRHRHNDLGRPRGYSLHVKDNISATVLFYM